MGLHKGVLKICTEIIPALGKVHSKRKRKKKKSWHKCSRIWWWHLTFIPPIYQFMAQLQFGKFSRGEAIQLKSCSPKQNRKLSNHFFFHLLHLSGATHGEEMISGIRKKERIWETMTWGANGLAWSTIIITNKSALKPTALWQQHLQVA